MVVLTCELHPGYLVGRQAASCQICSWSGRVEAGGAERERRLLFRAMLPCPGSAQQGQSELHCVGLTWICHTLRACVRACVCVCLCLCECVSKRDKEPGMDINVRKLGSESKGEIQKGRERGRSKEKQWLRDCLPL